MRAMKQLGEGLRIFILARHYGNFKKEKYIG